MTEYTRDFATWQEALPFALGIARKVARRAALLLDLESLVMEALWRAQTRGAVLSRGYVALRISGAVKDEMRKNALLGSRRLGYVASSDLCDVDDAAIAGESVDHLVALDLDLALGAELPERDRQVVLATLAGTGQRAIGAELGVSEARISQLLARATGTMREHLERKREIVDPARVAVPVLATPKFRVRDFKHELWLARRNELLQRMEPGMSMRALALKLRMSETTVYYWCTNRSAAKKFILGRRDPVSVAVQRRGQELIAAALRAEPAGAHAASLLKISGSCLWAWRRRLLPEVPLCPSGPKRRVDWNHLTALYEQGLTHSEIARQVGLAKPSVSAVMWKLGVRGRTWTRRRDISTEEVRRMRADGLSLSALARRFECSVTLVRGRLQRAA